MAGKACDRCPDAGVHLCAPRAQRVVNVFEQLLVHTKGRHARKPFKLARWQRNEIIVPLFGMVEWNTNLSRFVRRYRVGWIELARKNGKSELMAGVALVLLCADDEEGAEVYGCAFDKDQANKVFMVAERMVDLSPLLSKRLRVMRQARRIIDERTGSFYETVPADELGNVGHNPHGIIFDEVWTQRTGELWNAMRTGMGAREQPLLLAATTAGREPESFAGQEHDYSARVAATPTADRRRFTFMRNTPMEVDWTKEANWRHANPALGDFLSIEALRDECVEARMNPAKEQAFRQFRLNQWVRAETRWIKAEMYDATAGMVVPAQLVGQRCFGGLDLAAVSDLTSLCWFFPPATDTDPGQLLWRHFVPEASMPTLDDITAGTATTWAREGWLTVTDGEVCDYGVLHAAVAEDTARFNVGALGIDRWNSTATTTWLAANLPKLRVEQVAQTFAGLSAPMKEMTRMMTLRRFLHGADPVARWCFLACEVRTDVNENVRPIKPDRGKARHRIDAVVSAAMAVDGWLRNPAPPRRRAVSF